MRRSTGRHIPKGATWLRTAATGFQPQSDSVILEDGRHLPGRLLAAATDLFYREGINTVGIDRVIEHAQRTGCFFEINSSPDRLDLSAEHARLAGQAGVRIAISTDAHSTRKFGLIRCGIDQARRAGLEKESVLNCLGASDLCRVCRR